MPQAHTQSSSTTRSCEQVLGNGDALGRRFRYPAAGARETRVAADAANRSGTRSSASSAISTRTPIDPELVRPAVFHPLDTGASCRPRSLIKVRGCDRRRFCDEAARSILTSLDPAARVNVRPLADMERQQQLALRLSPWCSSLITIAVLLLSAAGIYALMSFTVSRRRKEIGIRAAMGADSRTAAPRHLRASAAQSVSVWSIGARARAAGRHHQRR